MTTAFRDSTSGAAARRLIRARSHAALATLYAGRPYVSLVATACAFDGSPLLLLSDLAQHSRNLAADPRASLLFEATGERPDPLAAARLSVLGRAERCDDRLMAARFAARHPTSADYAGFADFHLYRLGIEHGHLVAGFGRIAWIESADLRFAAPASRLAGTEAELIERLNRENGAALAVAMRRFGHRGVGWRITGIDPEGVDLRRGGKTARLDFAAPVLTAAAARRAFAALIA
ncbi:MAG TPA: pyridoxamine 5'-phosphate oxidase family protein [Stellaceae bacterium]|nr:pyridoxamine 5'-phosphate oxidase family protein [Stellaceae bacterium]